MEEYCSTTGSLSLSLRTAALTERRHWHCLWQKDSDSDCSRSTQAAAVKVGLALAKK